MCLLLRIGWKSDDHFMSNKCRNPCSPGKSSCILWNVARSNFRPCFSQACKTYVDIVPCMLLQRMTALYVKQIFHTYKFALYQPITLTLYVFCDEISVMSLVRRGLFRKNYECMNFWCDARMSAVCYQSRVGVCMCGDTASLSFDMEICWWT